MAYRTIKQLKLYRKCGILVLQKMCFKKINTRIYSEKRGE